MTEDEAKRAGECLALIKWDHEGDQFWCHLRWKDADGEGPMWDGEDVITVGHSEGWFTTLDDDPIADWAEHKLLAFLPVPEAP